MYISRTLESFVASSRFPVLMLSGARQVGKTTFLRHLSEPDRTYVTLDDPLVQSLAKEDPALFLQRFSPPVLIDEIQYAPELLPHIKIAVDRDRSPSQFWLTGSQQFHLMKGVSESLAGRVGIVQLFGLSRRERIGSDSPPFLPAPDAIHNRLQTGGILGLKELYRLIWRGDFPAIALDDQMDWNLFYSSYLQTYLQRDIRDLTRVGDELSFLRFLRAAAARTAQMLNFSDLARDADVAPNTAKTWLSILQASGIIYLLGPYYTNLTKRLVRSPKLYFLDTGLCAYLTEWSSPETLEAGAMSGPILESWIVSELLKSYRHNGHMPPFYYYRDRDGKEIDLLILRDGTIYPLEIKKTASPNKNHVRHFHVLKKLNMPIGPGGVICLSEQFLPLTETAMSIPVSAL
jgi:predicted AAA+ superfamily ATPase